ncbi:MAG: hypothetical protein LAT64_11515 [Phycisphaerales bacterium]|nr:hypothetical protein [Planctomycetota bacterium]MCH8509380.1 hypothetical protein [Phycisphaerales bacterium]
MKTNALILAALAGAAATAAQGQVVLNEIYENPPGSGAQFDSRYEYIELYGFPGMDLTGYAIALLKGGSDLDGDGIPGPRPPGFDPGEEVPEIDEAFSLDGLSLGSNGFLVIYNTNPDLNPSSFLPPFFPPETNVATFQQTHIPTVDNVGRLANDGSSTYVLVRRRPNHSINSNGVSVYGPGYSWRKDVQHDVDFDGVVDFGFETPVNYPLWPIEPPSVMEPYQMIDEIAWSHRSGKEYVRSNQNQISDTPNYNPDAISRLYYLGQNPQIGHRFTGSGNITFTRLADEEWIQGTITTQNPRFNYEFTGVVGNPRSKGPTDPDGPLYDGSCDPDTDPNCLPNPNGIYRFQDIDITGFQLTPGDFNDGGSANHTQFRFIPGDLNFDGVVDQNDLFLLDALLLGADFDATEIITDDFGLPIINPVTNMPLERYVFQGRLANAFLAATNLDPNDGVGGSNAPTVTQADRAVLVALLGGGPCNAADIAEPFGVLNFFDVAAYLTLFNAGDPAADLAAPFGELNFFDLATYLAIFNQGCP